jgi:uncharacterized protein (TIGR02117 family)
MGDVQEPPVDEAFPSYPDRQRADDCVIAKAAKALSIALLLIAASCVIGIVVPRPIFGSTLAGPIDGGDRVLVLSNAIHTDIAIAVTGDVRARFAFLRDGGLDIDNPNLRYLVFGWGGRSFYTQTPNWADLKPMPVFRSFTLDRAVMHVETVGDIALDGSDVTVVNLDRDGLERLLAFVISSFTTGKSGPIPLPGVAYGDYDAFFEGEGYFNALAGCNSWTGAGLRQAGVTTGWWAALPWMLRLSLRLHNATALFARPMAAQP